MTGREPRVIRDAKKKAVGPAGMLFTAALLGVGWAVLLAVTARPPDADDLFFIAGSLTWASWAFAAGWSLVRLRRPWVVVAGSVFVMLPLSGACPFGALVGVVTLCLFLDRRVRAGFAAVRRRDGVTADE